MSLNAGKFTAPVNALVSYTLGIKIDNVPIPDMEVKVIALLIYGLDYKPISQCLGIEPDSVKTKLCLLRGFLDVKNNYHLMRKAHAYGFDFNGHVYDVDVLEPRDRQCLLRYAPHIKRERKLPRLVFTD